MNKKRMISKYPHDVDFASENIANGKGEMQKAVIGNHFTVVLKTNFE